MEIRTLIVDDQDDIRVLLRMMITFANDGLVVSAEAANGEEALTGLTGWLHKDDLDRLPALLRELATAS